MMNPAKQSSQSYTALTHQVVREAEEPIPVAEIMRRVHSLRPIESQTPERLIRHAVSQARLIANTGDGRYWWYPRMHRHSAIAWPVLHSRLRCLVIRFP
jgi:hypothetical protein